MTPGFAWQNWLEGEFPDYLLACSRGHPRPAHAIDRALRHLGATDLSTLASLGFLLGGSHDLEGIRGRVDWGRTLVLRQQAFDPTLAATGEQGFRAAFRLPFQDIETSNHIPQWVTSVERHPCTTNADCGGEFCVDGRCFAEEPLL